RRQRQFRLLAQHRLQLRRQSHGRHRLGGGVGDGDAVGPRTPIRPSSRNTAPARRRPSPPRPSSPRGPVNLSGICPPKPSLPWPLSPGGREGNKTKKRNAFLPPLPLGEEGRGGEGFGGARRRNFHRLRGRGGRKARKTEVFRGCARGWMIENGGIGRIPPLCPTPSASSTPSAAGSSPSSRSTPARSASIPAAPRSTTRS